jgi:methylenetetrahydrofolate dehydrogenase (NAD+)
VYDSHYSYGNKLNGRTITIVNRSEVVGRPLAALLANDGAKVYSVDVSDILVFDRGNNLELRKYRVRDTEETLEDILPISDVVITGVPSPAYKVSTELMKEGVIAINFSGAKNFEDNINDRASLFVPAIGKVTTTMLQRNLVRLKRYTTNWKISGT